MKKLIISIFLLLLVNLLYANGGPVFDNKLGSTGNLTFVKKTALQLVKEDLKIKVDGGTDVYNRANISTLKFLLKEIK